MKRKKKLKKKRKKTEKKRKKTNHDVAEESDDKGSKAVPVHENTFRNKDHQAHGWQPECFVRPSNSRSE